MKIKSFSRGALFLIALINFYFLIAVRICDNHCTQWQTTIGSDGVGYYEYLRAAFISHTLKNETPSRGFIRIADGKPVIKFFAGPALAYSPFFFAAKVISLLRNETTEGYNFEFEVMIALAGWCYCLLGLFFIEKILQIFSIPDVVRAITLLLITFGTNLFYYSILEPSMSHVYAFACIAGFLFCAHKYFTEQHRKYLILASIFLALTILIRPTNIVVLFMLPFLMVKKENFFLFLKNFRALFLSATIVSSFVFIQMLFWHLQTGNWFVWSYTGEGFYFTRPAIANVLFSFDKGWFTYTPLAATAMFGFFPLWKMNRRVAISIALTLLAAVYFTAAWWCWDYGNSFGMRPMIDFYSLIAILLSVLISSLKKNLFKISAAILFAGVFLVSSIQTYQYYQGILQHYSMNREKYQFVFLKTGEHYKNILGGNVDLMPYTKKSPVLIHSASNSFSNQMDEWNAAKFEDDPTNASNKCFRFDSSSASLVYSFGDSSVLNTNVIYLEVSLRRMEFTHHSSSHAKVVTQLKNHSSAVINYEFALNDFPDENAGQWRTYHYAYWIRRGNKSFDSFSFEIQDPQSEIFLVDDAVIKIFRIEQ